MALITTKAKYHAAIDSIGLLLQGLPQQLAYSQNQAPIYGQRFASGDRDYTDFSFYWFWAQTDFSGGIKEETRWEDDGKILDSQNVDLSEKPGSVVLNWAFNTQVGRTKSVTWLDYGDVAGALSVVGRNSTDQKMFLMDAFSGTVLWEDSATGASEQINCMDSLGSGTTYLGCETAGSGSSYFKSTTGGSASDVGTFTTSPIKAMVPYHDGDSIYLFTSGSGIYVYSRSAGTFTQKTTAYPFGTAGTFLNLSSTSGKNIWRVGDRIYFLFVATNGGNQLWAYDIGDNAYVQIFRWVSGFIPLKIIARDDAVYIFGTNIGKSRAEVWKYSSTNGAMGRLFNIRVGSGTTQLVQTNVIQDIDYIYFVISDGTSQYRIWQIDRNDALFCGILPPTAYATNVSMQLAGTSRTGVALNGASGSNRVDTMTAANRVRQTTGNFKTSVFDGNVPAIDKLFNSVTVTFEKLTSSQTIVVEYSLDEGASFTTLGTVDGAVDGTSIVAKTLYFGAAVVAKSIMLKITLTGGGNAQTPTFNSYSARYIPVPDLAKSWQLSVNCADQLKALDGAPHEYSGAEVRARIEKSWLTKSLVDFQDLDFFSTDITGGTLSASATTITVTNTADAPSQGRLRIENEEILYTGKTPTSFTGCTRGARGTTATTHASSTVVSNAYRVMITECNARVPLMLQDKDLEYVMGITFREA